jgi:hypothetical protein
MLVGGAAGQREKQQADNQMIAGLKETQPLSLALSVAV